MQIKYSLKGLFALTAVAGVATFMQLRVDRNIGSIKSEINDATSQLHANDLAPFSRVPTEKDAVSITRTDIDFTALDLLLFRRKLKVNFDIQTTLSAQVPTHYKTRLKTGKDSALQYNRVAIARTVTAHVGPFGYTIEFP